MLKNVVVWVVVLTILASLLQQFERRIAPVDVPYSEFLAEVKGKHISKVVIEGNKIRGERKDGALFNSYSPETDNQALIGTLLDNGVEVMGREEEGYSLIKAILISWSPMILLFLMLWYFSRQMQGGMGGGRGALSFGKSRARMLSENQIKVTFEDVAGVDEAKEDLVELVDFLRNPGKFQRLGGKIPSGVLMIGPPGTGKTLLARAIAGEADVSFFTISGSDFVEMFVGVGASRVRDMFEEAKKHSPCIIFIDEIDAVGRHRGAGVGGGHDEREQTLNQLLVEMDGFEGNENVIVIAATNRPDVLDPALLRPGRFDRQVVVSLPDIRGREQILRVHMKKVPLGEDVNCMDIARGTPGFSGADLANLINEAALIAARNSHTKVMMEDMEHAKDKIMMGAERKSMVISDKEKQLTAYHEAGHAIVGLNSPGHDPVYKVTIIPRGRALGVTMFLPESDHLSYTREYLIGKIRTLFGGRAAEEIIFGEDHVTTGASNDIKQATLLARNMVTKWGLSEMGPLSYSDEEDEVFLGHSVTRHKSISDATTDAIDKQVRHIIETSHEQAVQVLKENMDKLHAMGDALIKYETIGKLQIEDIMNGNPPRPPADWPGDDGVRPSQGDAVKKQTKATEGGDPPVVQAPDGSTGTA